MIKHRIKLNQNQTTILQLLYKFRFSTALLLAERQKVTKVASTNSLKVLMNLGYIDRKFEKSYKLLGKSATYYLTKMGIKYLRDNFNVDERAIHTMYKNAAVSETFAQHCLDVFRAYLNIKELYGDEFTVLARPEVLEYDYMPEPSPDLYLTRASQLENKPNKYLLDILTDTQFFIVKKRIDAYIKHSEEGDWPEKVYPTILIICDDSRIEDKLTSYVQKQLEDNYIENADLIFMTTTKRAFLAKEHITDAIWTNISNPSKTQALQKL